MAWDTFTLEWLARSAAGGFVILAAAAIAISRCREPADRVRVTALALVGALLVPWVALVPSLPRWSVEVLPAGPVPAVATPVTPPAFLPERMPEYRPTPEPISQPMKLNPDEPGAPPTPAAGEVALPATVAITPVAAPPASEGASIWSVWRVVLVAYATFTVLIVLWSLLGLWRLVVLLQGSRPAPPEVVTLLREIAGLGAERVRLLVSDSVDAPVALAGWRSVIVLPANAASDRDALAYGLAHEWSHVERGDVWRWYLVALAQIVLFYQPLFWWLRRQLRLSQDYLADAHAATQAAEPTDYAEYLVTLARRRLAVPALALGITDRRSNLTRRVHMLLLNQATLSRRCRLAWTLGSAAVAVVLVAGLSAVRLTAAQVREDPRLDAKKPADAPKGEKLSYTGKVTDKDTGKAIAGAVVTVRRSLYGDPEVKEADKVVEETKHTTNAEGKYSFVIPPEQSSKRYLYIELDVEHADYAPRKGFGYALSMILKNEKFGGRPFFESVEMRPAKPVTGVVKTPDGKPAAGVKVMAYSVTNKRSQGEFEYGSFADTRTDADGNFRIPLTTPGWAVVWVLPEKYVPTTHVVKDKRGDLGTFTLQDGPKLRGVLLDAKGKPLPGVIVNADSRDRNDEITEPVADNINRSAITNEKGEFVMNPLPPGSYLVKPGDYQHDASLDRKDRRARTPGEVPGVFIGTKVTLKAGTEPEALEVKAVPHVTIEAQYYDSKGKTTRGHAPHVFGQIDGVSWFGEAKADANGKVTVHVPHGLENVQLNMMTNEHGSLRWRKKKDDPLSNNRTVMLGTLTDDVRGMEIIRYVAPILTVKVTTKDGSKPVKPAVTAVYPKGKARDEGRFILRNGRESDVSFEEQEDGRYRSSQLFPDEEVTVTAHAEGYASKSEKLKLEEGTTKEIEIVLEKSEKKEEKKN